VKGVAATDTFNDDPKRVAKLIDDLGNDAFAVREQATKDLRNLGPSIGPALRKAIEATDNLEAKRRLQRLLEAAGKSTAPELLRVGRALEALELMSEPEAREALKTLEKDLRAGWLRSAVSAAIGRQGATKP
jgi:HEAT repeat protein